MYSSQSAGYDLPATRYRPGLPTPGQQNAHLRVLNAERTFRQNARQVIGYHDHPGRDREARTSRRVPPETRLSRLHPGLAPTRVRGDDTPVLFAPVDTSLTAQNEAIVADLVMHRTDCARRRLAQQHAAGL